MVNVSITKISMGFFLDQPVVVISRDAWWDKCAKLRAPLLRMRFARCISTVRGEIISRFAIILLLYPEQTSSRICVSRGVKETLGVSSMDSPFVDSGRSVNFIFVTTRGFIRIAAPIRSYMSTRLGHETPLSAINAPFLPIFSDKGAPPA